jgi:hypothetical protein
VPYPLPLLVLQKTFIILISVDLENNNLLYYAFALCLTKKPSPESPQQGNLPHNHMQCERLVKLIKSWYVSVRDETMAPARMVTFMQQHTESCEACLHDPDVLNEIAKITELILPESKIPKAIRQQDELDEESEDFEDDEFLSGEKTSDDEELEEEEENLDEIEPEEEFLEDDED